MSDEGSEKDYVFLARTKRDIDEMKNKFRRTLESFKEIVISNL